MYIVGRLLAAAEKASPLGGSWRRRKAVTDEGERWERRRWRIKRPERVAAVDKIEDQRKPDDFIGHRNRKTPPLIRLASARHLLE